jgi:hypothetical protein
MPHLWDVLASLRSSLSGIVGDRRAAPDRSTVRLQLEPLEKREVLDAAANYQFLEGTLTAVVQALPAISSLLNSLPAQYQQFGVQVADSLLLGLESATQAALYASLAGSTAVPQDPIFNANVQAINYFMSNPLHDPYSYPPGIFGP